MSLFSCSSSLCNFDKITTSGTLLFDLLVLVAVPTLLYIFYKYDKKVLLKFGVIAFGIFIFEFFTHPLWFNYKLGSLAYVYRDVSWILTFGWAIIMLGSIKLINNYFVEKKEHVKSFLFLALSFVIGIIAETVVVNLGIRGYAPETLQVIGDKYIPFLNIPLASLYYIPVFMSLVFGFYKYWELVIENKLLVPIKKRRWLRDLLIATIGVLLFELMIEPMAVNVNLPKWSYIYRDVSFLMTGGWIIIIWLSVSIVDKFFSQLNLIEKFVYYIGVATVITLPAEVFLMNHGYRVYSESAVANFSGFTIPYTQIPIEVMFAIPFYLALVVGFIKFWIYTLENKDIK